MSFQQGLSGLAVNAQALDVTSNNIANTSTVGFKSSKGHFADMYAGAMQGGGGTQAGIGATVTAVAQQFQQGTITATNNPLDLSINGRGFFGVFAGGVEAFTRNGEFHLDKDGYVVNDAGQNLRGVNRVLSGGSYVMSFCCGYNWKTVPKDGSVRQEQVVSWQNLVAAGELVIENRGLNGDRP